ncbi:MAG: DNA mismatch repair endonuclease MutL [Dehalococcoidia bacterium]|nr:DNA mismatch repair endonuclease MutL [Dehalococcoidia bacterium]
MAAKIAAGEVIDRPVSVVKELVENAVDSSATDISVAIASGGIKSIRVTDNGSGIPSGELELAFKRHATSKITSLDDLERIATLGFRGEALASISAVATAKLSSRTAYQTAGSFVVMNSDGVQSQGRAGMSQGTTVLVTDLFKDIPARFKFLKSEASEASRITTLIGCMAFAYPNIRFSLTVDGKQIFTSKAGAPLRETAALIYSKEVASSMLDVDSELDTPSSERHRVKVLGLISAPTIQRMTRAYLTFFINRRLVQSRSLSAAVESAYQGMLMTGRHPVAVINIEMPYENVDVNVHPTKAEVRFRDDGLVFAAVQRSVRAALIAGTPVPPMVSSSAVKVGAGGMEGAPPQTHYQPQNTSAQTINRPLSTDPQQSMPIGAVPVIAAQTTMLTALPSLRVLGQLGGTYVVAEGQDGMYLIDQHAAHERINFDHAMKEHRDKRVRVQGLLEPVVVQITPHQQSAYISSKAALAEYGFLLEPFGTQTYLVRSVPAMLAQSDPTKSLTDALDFLGGEESRQYDWEQRIALSLVCHNAIRAGKSMTMREMEELVRQLEETDLPHACPHGRPTMLHVSQAHLEREFGRRQ